jgi:hypothetical protein
VFGKNEIKNNRMNQPAFIFPISVVIPTIVLYPFIIWSGMVQPSDARGLSVTLLKIRTSWG